jgi:autotransporter-associated beta strand protein
MTGKLNMVVNDGMYLQGSGFGADVNVSVSNGATLELGLIGPPSVSTVLSGNLSVATGGKVGLAQNASCNALTLGTTLQTAGTYGSTASSATTKNDVVFDVTYSGVLTVNSGASPLPANKVSNQTGNWNNPAIWTPVGVPALNDNVRVFPGHTVTLNSAVNTGTGKLTVDGTLALAGFDVTTGALVGSGTISSASGTPMLTVGSNNTNDIWNGAYSGTGARFTKVGTGSFFFAGGLNPNTYTGATTINAGRVQIATANERLSNSTDVFVASGAIFDMGGRTETVRSIAGAGTVTSVFNGGVLIVSGPASTTFSGIMQNGTSGTLAFTKAGTGTLTLTGANTYTGATNVSGGTLQLGVANERISNSSALTVASGAFFDLNGVSETIGSLTGAGRVTSSVAGSVTLTHGSNSSSTFSGVIQNGSGTVALTKSGTGTLTLTGANTYTGATSITAGTLIAGHSTALGSGSSVSVSSGATLRTNAGLSLGSLSIAGVMNCNGNNSTCTNLILGTTLQTNSGTYGSTASSATFKNNTRFTSTSTGVVTLTIPLVPSTFPGGTSIQARARWGATGYEGGLFIGGTVGPTLNPTGTPVWVIGTAYKFEYGYNGTTGEQSLRIDFNGNNSFGTGEVITQSTAFAGQGFKHFSIFMSGDATRGITLNNFVVNGVNLGNHVSPTSGSLDLDWESAAGLFNHITATGTITFTGVGGATAGETGRIWFRTAGALPAAIMAPEAGYRSAVNMAADARLVMFPNPNNGDQLTMSLSAVEEGVNTISVDIFDLSGARVSSRTISVNGGMVQQVLSLGEMAEGMYMVSITAGTQRYTERLVIQK